MSAVVPSSALSFCGASETAGLLSVEKVGSW